MRKIIYAVCVTYLVASCSTAERGIGLIAAPDTPELVAAEKALRDSNEIIDVEGTLQTIKPRVAVVIGNNAYTSVGVLDNPRNDARAMAGMLRSYGFHVIEGLDVDKPSFESALRAAVIEGGPSAESLFFYAGHGFQIGDKNYLVPVEARITDAYSLPFQTVTLENVFALLRGRSSQQVSLLDACRNNPFAGAQVMSTVDSGLLPTELGFTEPKAPESTLVSYSTSPGALAYDGEGDNSPYTASLLDRAVARAAAPLSTTLPNVRTDVQNATNGQQTPTWSSALEQPFLLNKPAPEPAAIDVAAAMGPPALASAKTAPQVVAASVAPSAIEIDAPYERWVALGARLGDVLGVSASDRVRLSGQPNEGRLALVGEGGALLDRDSPVVDGAHLGALLYVLGTEQKEAGLTRGANVIVERFNAEIRPVGGDARTVDVTLRLIPGECDYEAGEWFDIQGTGLFRTNEKLSASTALEACRAAVEANPNSGRFHHQLGRAQLAAGNVAGARRAFTQAAEQGHARSHTALGELALGAGDKIGARQNFERGVALGDPVAYRALGALLLGEGGDKTERQFGFDLLSRAVDVGIVDAMRDLSDYYGTPTSPDHDPGRSESYAREASTRSASLGFLSGLGATPADSEEEEQSDGGGGGGGY